MASEAYRALAASRRRVCYSLTTINVVLYMLYILSMGYARDWMSMPIAGSAVNVGLVFTIFLVIFAAVLSGFYIWWANKHYDPALKKLLTSRSATNP